MQIGFIKANVYTSSARIPIEKALFSVIKKVTAGEELVSVRLTDKNGSTSYISIEAPDSRLSQFSGEYLPYTSIDIRVDHPQFKTYYVSGVQVFAGQVSLIEAELMPIDRNVAVDMRLEKYSIQGQNL